MNQIRESVRIKGNKQKALELFALKCFFFFFFFAYNRLEVTFKET